MRIFGIEISRSPKTHADGTVWYRSHRGLPKRLGDLTPTELRRELSLVQRHIRKGGTFRMTSDGKQLIYFNEE